MPEKIKYFIKNAKTWNKTQSGGQLRKNVFYDKIDRVLGTRDVVTLKHVVKAGTHTDSPIANPTSPSTDDSVTPGSSSGTPSPQPSTRGTSETSSGESSNTVNCPSRARKERKRATREKYLKMEKMKRQLHSRGASNRLKCRAKS